MSDDAEDWARVLHGAGSDAGAAFGRVFDRGSCALAGHPEVRFLSGGEALGHHTGNQIDLRRSTDQGVKAVVDPVASAYSRIHWYGAGEFDQSEGPCVERPVDTVQADLAYDLTDPEQTGTLTIPIGATTASLNGEHGALGEYGQISSTVFVDCSAGSDE